MDFIPSQYKIGILGGGQLGKMLAQEASKLDMSIHFLDKDRSFPAAKVCPDFTEGDFNNYEDVLRFGRNMQVVSIEIEHVNTKALHQLESEGILVFPQAKLLDLIKDKGLQKLFYKEHGFATAPFMLFEDKSAVLNALQEKTIQFPFVIKSRTGGYDGRGVAIINSEADLGLLFDTPCLVEQLAKINKELSVIAIRAQDGNCVVYPTVSMDFHPTANLVEYLICPATIPSNVAEEAQAIAKQLINKLGIIGILAIEMFYLEDGGIWINEIAPRPHNSGHHTLDNGATSQFENHLRALCGLQLGDPNYKELAIMINILGEPPYIGNAIYQNLNQILALPGVHVHLYGKTETRPYRKMGHVTVTGNDLNSCLEKANFVKQYFKVIA
ncbi:MAG TPA: 5-(carboxyamino)imidazole ribonucleotide synthase [Saprospiraceae bacterium]|nr:5-(carboxyamino)imidazole ribonucleotide synthase [Saprospiraceae bacterium]